LWENLAEEIFFFLYHMRQPQTETLKLPIILRKWLINKFIEQKEKENQHMESERRKIKRK
jgi:hypothetical protein